MSGPNARSASDATCRGRAEAEARDRAVDVHRERTPHQLHVIQSLKFVSWRKDENLVPAFAEMMRQLAHVPLNATGRIPSVGANLNYPHAVAVRVKMRWPLRGKITEPR